MADPLAGATLGPIGGDDPLKGATLGPIDPNAPNFVQRMATKVSDAATSAEASSNLTKAVGGLGLVRALVSPFQQRTDPTGQGKPLGMGEAAVQDIGAGLAQVGGAAAGEALGGPVGAMAGSGLGATAADIALAKFNQQVHGWGYNPTVKGAAGTFLLGAATEGIPRGTAAGERYLLGRKLTKEGAQAGEAAVEGIYKEDLPKAKPGFEAAVTKAEADKKAAVEAAKANARGEVSQKVVPKAAQMELENFVGRTPAETEAIKNNPADYFARRSNAMKNGTVWGPMNKISDELGKQYELAAPQEVLIKPAGDMTITNGTVQKELDTIEEKGLGQVSPKVMKLVQAMQHTGDSDWGLVAGRDGTQAATRMLKNDPASLEAYATRIRDEAVSSHQAGVNAANRELLAAKNARHVAQTPELAARMDEEIKDAEARLAKAQAAPIKPFGVVDVPALTNADLLSFRRLASGLVGAVDGPSSVAASTIRDAIDNKLESNGIKIPPDLNMKYKLYKDVFSPSFRREVAGAVHPEEYAKSIFTEPQRFNPLWKQADAGDKVALRNLFKDWAISVGPKGIGNMIEKRELSSAVPRTLFGDSAYSRLAPWIDSDAKAMGWESALAAAPAPLKQQMMVDARDEMQKGIQDAAMKGAIAITKAGKDLARSLGPAGNGIMARLNSSDPVAAARYVKETLLPMMQQVPEPMPDAASSAMATYRANKDIAKGVDINAKRDAAAAAAIRDAAHKGDTWVKNLLKKAQFYVPLLVALSATGHPSPYLLAAGAYSLLGSLIYSPRGAMLKALDDDFASTMFYRGIKMAPNTLNAKGYAQNMGRAAAALVVRQIVKKSGLSAGQPPEEKEGEGE